MTRKHPKQNVALKLSVDYRPIHHDDPALNSDEYCLWAYAVFERFTKFHHRIPPFHGK